MNWKCRFGLHAWTSWAPARVFKYAHAWFYEQTRHCCHCGEHQSRTGAAGAMDGS